MQSAFSGVMTILIMIAAGYILAKSGWINSGIEDFLVKLSVRFAVPCVLFENAVRYISPEVFKSGASVVLVPPLTIATTFGLSLIIAPALGVKKSDRGLFTVIFSMANTIFVGLPVCTEIFGEPGITYVILYYLGNTVLFWSVGVALIARDGGVPIKADLAFVKRIFSPPLLGFIAGAAVSFSGLKLPEFFMKAVSGFGGMNTPLCMLIIGSSIAGIGIKNAFRLGKTGAFGLLGRFVISPAIVIAACLAFGVPALPASVYTAEATMPVMNQAMLMTKYYGANEALATRSIAASMILMLAAIPAVIFVSGAIFG